MPVEVAENPYEPFHPNQNYADNVNEYIEGLQEQEMVTYFLAEPRA